MSDIQLDTKPFTFINTPLWLIASLAIVVSLYNETIIGPVTFGLIFLISIIHFKNLTPLIAFPTFICINAEFVHNSFFAGFTTIPWKVPLLLCVIVYVLDFVYRQIQLKGFAVSPYFYLGWFVYLLFVSFKTHSISFPLYVFVGLLFGLSTASQLFANENRENGRFLLILFFFSILFMMIVGYTELIFERTFLLSKWTQEERYRYGIIRMGSTVADGNFLCSMLIPSLFIFNTRPFKKILTPSKTAIINVFIVLQIILTFSRTGLLIFLIGIFFVFLLRSKHIKILLAMSLPIVLFAVIKIIPLLLDVDSSSNAARMYVNALAFRVFMDNPVFGIGLGNFTTISENTTDSVVGALDTMNTYSGLLMSGGIICLLFYIGYIWLVYNKSKHLDSNDRIFFLAGFLAYNLFIFTLDSFFIYYTWIFPAILLALIQLSTCNNTVMENCNSGVTKH